MTATQTMEVVYGLFNNMKVVMDGMEHCLTFPLQYVECLSLDGNASIDNIREALGMKSLEALESVSEYG